MAASASASDAHWHLLPLSPPVQLHSHALESVFSFLSFRELATIAVRVAPQWQHAVRHMAPLQYGYVSNIRSAARFEHVMHSAVAHHCRTLLIDAPAQADEPTRILVTAARMRRIAACMPSLTDLTCALSLAEADSGDGLFSGPPHSAALQLKCLRHVQLDFSSQPDATAAELGVALHFLSGLPALDELHMTFPTFAAVDISSLAAASSLRSLTIRPSKVGDALSAAHAAQLRLLAQLTLLSVPLQSDEMIALLAPPCPLRHLQRLDVQPALRLSDSDELCAALLHAPSLTQFDDPNYSRREAAFLQRLPNLRCAHLGFQPHGMMNANPHGQVADDYALILRDVSRCASLTELRLSAFSNRSFTVSSDQLAQMIDGLLLLQSLSILLNIRFDSLRFLSAGKLQTELRQLWLRGVGLRLQAVDEAEQLTQLTALTKLTISSTEFRHVESVTQQLVELFGQQGQRQPLLTEFR